MIPSMKLFAILIGGDVAGANLELHDVRFAVAERIEDTYDQLRREWWGTPASLHLDCWAELTGVDGHTITLAPEPFTGPQKLYFIHLGGYDGSFNEAHQNLFLVADSAQRAKARAIASVNGWKTPHRDTLFEIDKIINLSGLAEQQSLHVHLQPGGAEGQPSFVCNYRKIGLKLREA